MADIINPCTNTVYLRSGIKQNNQKKILTVVVVSYKGYTEIETMINSFLSQKVQNYKMVIGHDGPDEKMENIVKKYSDQYNFIKYFHSEKRMNQWGHNLRNEALKYVDTPWIVNTNDDNYYVPIFTRAIQNHIKNNPGVQCLMYNAVHSYFNYAIFKPRFKNALIDMGQFVIQTKMVKNIKFDPTRSAADGRLVNQIKQKYNPKIIHINKTLFIHN